MKTNLKEKKAAKLAAQKEADTKLYRLMLEFVLALIALFLAITAGNNQLYTLSKVMPLFLTVSGVLFGASALYFCVKRAKNSGETTKVITSAGIFGNAAALFLLSAAFYLFMRVELVISVLIALTVVYIAYNIDGAGFFGYSVITAASYIAICLSQGMSYYPLGNGIILASKVLSFVIPVLGIVLSVMLLLKKNGVRVLGVAMAGRKIALAMIITSLIALVGAVLMLVYPAGVMASVYAMLVCYFVVTVVGIFKMM